MYATTLFFFTTTIQCSLKVQFWYVAKLGKTNITSAYAKFNQFSLLVAMHHYAAPTCCDWLSNFFIFLRLTELEILWSNQLTINAMLPITIYKKTCEEDMQHCFNMLYKYLQPAVTVKSGSTKYSSQIETT